MSSRIAKILGIFTATAVIVLAVLYLALFRVSKPEELQSVRVGIQDNAITALVVLAKELGYFEDEGLNVELVKYPSGKLAFKGMLDGEVDLATSADMPIMIKAFERDDFRVICSIAKTAKGAWIIARRDAGIEKPEDLKGKRIATQKNSAVHYFLNVFLLSNRIAEDDVEIVFMPAAELAPALSKGRIDAFSMRNPFIAEAKQRLGDNAVELFAPEVYYQIFNLLGMAKYIDAHPNIVEGLVNALLEAESFMADGGDEASNLLIEYFGEERREGVSDGIKRYRFGVDLGQALLLTLDNEAQWAIQKGLVAGTDTPNYFHFLYFDALEKIDPDRVSVIK